MTAVARPNERIDARPRPRREHGGPSRVCLVGAGFIADTHAAALATIPDAEVTAVVDVSAGKAEALARTLPEARAFESIRDAVATGNVDCAHVLVPPPLHRSLAEECLDEGLDVLVEKPLAASATDCRELAEHAERRGRRLGVNQNAVHHPAFARLLEVVRGRQLGRLRNVTLQANLPLRQLAARQFSHWMFHRPLNLLLEQAVHPLSQLAALLGELELNSAVAGGRRDVVAGVPVHAQWQASFRGGDVPAQLLLSLGAEFPFWQVTAVCDDGVVTAEPLRNQYLVRRRGRGTVPFDDYFGTRRTSRSATAQAFRQLRNHVLSTLRVRPRSDVFFSSMRDSLAAFHRTLQSDENESEATSAAFGTRLVSLCEAMCEAAGVSETRPRRAPSQDVPPATCDVAVLGATGFIGRTLVQRLSSAGATVRAVARGTANRPPIFDGPGVSVVNADATSEADVRKAVRGARCVLNLTHGAANGLPLREAIVRGAETIARACAAEDVERLVHASSIAALYLGDAEVTITAETPPDPRRECRGDYSRGKAEAEDALEAIAAETGLPICIVRPGIVVGEDGTPFHGGLGLFPSTQHCLGWNDGRKPLPFVLVEDVAEAIVSACETEDAVGRRLNLVGDVRPTAQEYLAELARALERPLQFHPQGLWRLYGEELGKWTIKRCIGRRVPVPSLRDLRSRGMPARFDTREEQRLLNWRPVADRERFVERAIHVHRRGEDRS